MWKPIENKEDLHDLPDDGEHVLVICHGMSNGNNGTLMVAQHFDGEWYAFFPYDQPVTPSYWCYSVALSKNDTFKLRFLSMVKTLLKRIINPFTKL